MFWGIIQGEQPAAGVGSLEDAPDARRGHTADGALDAHRLCAAAPARGELLRIEDRIRAVAADALVHALDEGVRLGALEADLQSGIAHTVRGWL